MESALCKFQILSVCQNQHTCEINNMKPDIEIYEDAVSNYQLNQLHNHALYPKRIAVTKNMNTTPSNYNEVQNSNIKL